MYGRFAGGLTGSVLAGSVHKSPRLVTRRTHRLLGKSEARCQEQELSHIYEAVSMQRTSGMLIPIDSVFGPRKLAQWTLLSDLGCVGRLSHQLDQPSSISLTLTASVIEMLR